MPFHGAIPIDPRDHLRTQRDGALVLSLEGRVLWANPSAHTVLGPRSGALEGEWFGLPSVSGDRTLLDVPRSSGPCHLVEMRVSNIAWDGVQALLVTLRDLTRRRSWRRKVQRLGRLLRQTRREQDRIMALLAHELRNPLAPLLNAVEVLGLREGPAAEEQARRIIERQARHMARIVEDLLDLARARHGRIRLRQEFVEVGALLHRSAESARAILSEHDHTLVVEGTEHTTWLKADPVWMEQVLLHLLHNSAKYTPTGGRLRLAAIREGDSVTLSVRDNGMGLDPARLDEVFNLYKREDQATIRDRKGLGIGLALVRAVVGLHDGKVWAESPGHGKGAEFFVRLPAAIEPEAGAAPRPPPDPVGGQRKPLRVLIVDDNRTSADSLGWVLKHWGHQAVALYDGRSALEAIATFGPDVVIADLDLPDLDGYEVAARLGERRARGEVRLIALTGMDASEVKQEHVHLFDDHFTKPLDFEKIEAVLRLVNVKTA